MKCLILQHQTMESHVPQDIVVGIDVGERRSPVVSGHPRASPAEGLFHPLPRRGLHRCGCGPQRRRSTRTRTYSVVGNTEQIYSLYARQFVVSLIRSAANNAMNLFTCRGSAI